MPWAELPGVKFSNTSLNPKKKKEKGKERKGKERKGKERKGKERKGKGKQGKIETETHGRGNFYSARQ
jgi:hypothetical protein